MTPLQKIAMGMLITILPAPFPAHPHPAWAYYNALPAPIGWLLVISGVRALSDGTLRSRRVLMLAVVAFAVSVPLWFPQINHLLVPAYNHGVSRSWSWFAALPGWAFSLLLAHELGRLAAEHLPRDRTPETVFGGLRVAFVAVIALPAIVYGAPAPGLETTMGSVRDLSEIGLVIALFSYNKRSYYQNKTAASQKETAVSK